MTEGTKPNHIGTHPTPPSLVAFAVHAYCSTLLWVNPGLTLQKVIALYIEGVNLRVAKTPAVWSSPVLGRSRYFPPRV